MAKVTIYTTPICPYCISAKRLLSKKGAAVEEINVMGKPETRAQMVAKAGGRTTVPQIWIGDAHVGGCDDLFALEAEGRLHGMLVA